MTDGLSTAGRVCVGVPSAGCDVDEAGSSDGCGGMVSSIGINGGSCGGVGIDGSGSAGTRKRPWPEEEVSVKSRKPRPGGGARRAGTPRGLKPVRIVGRALAPAAKRKQPSAGDRADFGDGLTELRRDIERLTGHIKDAIQKIERLTIAVADLQDDVADLQASLGDGEIDYGSPEEDNSEMGEGHA